MVIKLHFFIVSGIIKEKQTSNWWLTPFWVSHAHYSRKKHQLNKLKKNFTFHWSAFCIQDWKKRRSVNKIGWFWNILSKEQENKFVLLCGDKLVLDKYAICLFYYSFFKVFAIFVLISLFFYLQCQNLLIKILPIFL